MVFVVQGCCFGHKTGALCCLEWSVICFMRCGGVGDIPTDCCVKGGVLRG